VDTTAWPIATLVDRVLTTHVAWRETTDAVADSYGQLVYRPDE
jgi:hypothetical protein